MSKNKKISATGKSKNKVKKRTANASTPSPKVLPEHEVWENIRGGILKECLAWEDLDPLEQKIRATAGLLSDLDCWEDPSMRYRKLFYDPSTGVETTEYRAWLSASVTAQTTQQRLLQITLNGLLEVIEHGNGQQAEYAINSLASSIVRVLHAFRRLGADAKKRELFRKSALHRVEYPALLSLFRRENLNWERFVLNEFELGGGLPFAADPHKPYTAYTLLAMRIVEWIDYERTHGWVKTELRSRLSVYRKVDPDLDKKDFIKRYAAPWERVIGFHLDYFQAPRERQRRTAFEYCLEAEWNERDKDNRTLVREMYSTEGHLLWRTEPSWFSAFFQFGEITKMREFQGLLKTGRDRNVKNETDLYSRVKHKVIAAAIGLMKR